MQQPLIERLPNRASSTGVDLEAFGPTGPVLEHRSLPRPVRLIFPCDLANLDACLQRLPQDRPRMGFRVNINAAPWLLKPSGRWVSAKISRREGRRLGWEPAHWIIHPQGLCSELSAISFYRQPGAKDLPWQIRIAEALTRFCEDINANPVGIREYGLDSNNSCMCCGKSLSVEKSQTRGIGPECLQVLDCFLGLGTDQTIAEIEQQEVAQ